MLRRHPTWGLALAMALLVIWQTAASAQSALDLQVSSDTGSTVLTLADLDTMEQTAFSTTTIWTDGEVSFSGVSLKSVLERINAEGTKVEMVALNDYKIVMPTGHLEDGAPIIATRKDGETMSVRDKGPFWVVFPYDQDPRYQTETIYSFSIWQLNRLKVVD